MQITYSYNSSTGEMYSGSPVLTIGDSIIARITGATPGGVVRMTVTNRGASNTVVGEQVLGNVGVDGNFIYTYVISGAGSERLMLGLSFSVDKWTVQAADMWGWMFKFVVGEWSQKQISESPFTTPATQLNPSNPYYVDPNGVGVVNPTPPPASFDKSTAVNNSKVNTGDPTDTQKTNVNTVSGNASIWDSTVDAAKQTYDDIATGNMTQGEMIGLGVIALVGFFMIFGHNKGQSR